MSENTRRALSPKASVATAYHEAGHAVIARRLGFEVESATIVPGDDYDGEVIHDCPPLDILNCDAPDRLRARKLIAIGLAGPAAERRHNPHAWRSDYGAADQDIAICLAICVSESVDTTVALLVRLDRDVQNEVAVLWPTIERVAAALLERKTLSGPELEGIMASTLTGPGRSGEEAADETTDPK